MTQSAAAAPCAIAVVGAGRSGTSAITRGVQAIGVDLGDRLRPGGGKNPTGFFEDQDLLALNKRLKRLLGIRGDSVALFEPEVWQTPPLRALHDDAVATIRRRFGGTPLWGYKYARTLRLLPFWRAVFAELAFEVRYVVALRNPLSVARSRAKLDPRRGTQEKSDLEWLVNVVPYFRLLRERPFVVVDYDLVMADPLPQLERMATGIGLPITGATRASMEVYGREFLRPGMRHSRFTEGDLDADRRLNPVTRDAFRWLFRLATDAVGRDDVALWQDWERLEGRVQDLAPVLRHVDRVEEDLRRAQTSPIGPLQMAPQLWRKLRSK